MYFYQSTPRLQLFFQSPNQLATILGMAILIAGGALAFCLNRYSIQIVKRKLPLILLAALNGILILLLVQTYSRGGWVAFIVALSILYQAPRSGKRVCLFLLIVFVILSLTIPNATDRAASTLNREDCSITHRIVVWKGAAAMTADNWFNGVGLSCFGREFTAWYQPLNMKTRYQGALNNYLTISAESGIFTLWFYLLLVLAVLWNAYKRAMIHQHIFAISLICAEVAYLVSGLFTYSITHWEISWLFWLLLSILMAYLFMYRIKFQLKEHLIPPVALATGVCIVILGIGIYLSNNQPLQINFFSFANDGLKHKGVIIRPKKGEPLDVVVYIHDRLGSIRSDGSDALRYLAEKGHVVIAVDYRDNGLEGLKDIQAITAWVMQQKQLENYPVYLIGFDLGGRLAILTACHNSFPRIKAVVSIGSAAEWPFSEISPSEHIQNLSCPLLIVHGEDDLVNPVSQAHLLQKMCTKESKRCELFIIKDEDHFLGKQWSSSLDRVSDFLLQLREPLI